MVFSRKCENCKYKINKSAENCQHCGVSLVNFRHPLSLDGDWVLRSDELAAAIPFAQLQGSLSRSVTVQEGFTGYIVEHEMRERDGSAACYEIGPGTETIQGWLTGFNLLGGVRRGMVYLARNTATSMPFSVEARNKDLLPIQITVQVELGIGNLPQFAQASMGGLQVYTRTSLRAQIFPMVEIAARAWTAEQSMRQLQTMEDAGSSLSGYLARELSARARDLGLELRGLALIEFSHERELGKRVELAQSGLELELYEEAELQQIERMELEQQLEYKRQVLEDNGDNSALKRRVQALDRLEQELELNQRELGLMLNGEEREAALRQAKSDNAVRRKAAADELREELAEIAKIRHANVEHRFEMLQLDQESELARRVEAEDGDRAEHHRGEQSKTAEFERAERRKAADERRDDKMRELQAELDRLVLQHDQRDLERVQSGSDHDEEMRKVRDKWELNEEQSGRAIDNLKVMRELDELHKDAKARRRREETELIAQIKRLEIETKAKAGDAAWIVDANPEAMANIVRLREIEAGREMSPEQIMAQKDPRAAAEALKGAGSSEAESLLRELLDDKDRMYERLERMTDKQRDETLKLAEILAGRGPQNGGGGAGTVVNVSQAAGASGPRCPNASCPVPRGSDRFCSSCGTTLIG